MICYYPLDITYSLAPDGSSITFHPCGITSRNPGDVKHRYCARCHRYMALIEAAKEVNRKWSEPGGDV